MTKPSPPLVPRSRENETFSRCLAEILKADVNTIPAACNGLGREGIGYWLAARNLALIPVLAPASFEWAGWWIGQLSGGDGYVVMAGTPSGVAWVPDGVTCGTGDVIEGWVIAPPALSLPKRDATSGTIEAIYRYADSDAPGELLPSARLIAGVGIEGDRYALGKGHFQSEGRWGQALTLIEAEAIATLTADHGVAMLAVDARRNIVTRNIDLNALMGNGFGSVISCAKVQDWPNPAHGCKGRRLRECCADLSTAAVYVQIF